MIAKDLELTLRLGNRVATIETVPPNLAEFLAVRRAQLRAQFGVASVREQIDERLYHKALDFAIKDGLIKSKRRHGRKPKEV